MAHRDAPCVCYTFLYAWNTSRAPKPRRSSNPFSLRRRRLCILRASRGYVARQMEHDDTTKRRPLSFLFLPAFLTDRKSYRNEKKLSRARRDFATAGSGRENERPVTRLVFLSALELYFRTKNSRIREILVKKPTIHVKFAIKLMSNCTQFD